MTQERAREASGSQEKVTAKVFVHGANEVVTVEVDKNATLQDILDAVKEKFPNLDLKSFTIRFMGRTIEVDQETGKLKENPVITENVEIALLQNFRGGLYQS